MSIQLRIGLDVISSYKRLAYTPWHALAEFVDNSTQSYFNNEAQLLPVMQRMGRKLTVSIAYDENLLRISDNAMGMSLDELQTALTVALPPTKTDGRSKYGMGLKTAACWLGNKWTVRTKKLGETVEHRVTVNVPKIAAGNNELPYEAVKGKPLNEHYTVIEIFEHNKYFRGRTVGRIKDFLRSMYREDFRNRVLLLEWQNVELTWEELDDKLLIAKDGSKYKKDFEFELDGKFVKGWVGILDTGSRADAGFSIIHCGRVIRGWPDSWRPTSLYGQLQGTNDLVNQRLVGEIHLDDFDVSHTKDDILWLGTQEEDVERELKKHCGDYRDAAQSRRKKADDQRGPSQIETNAALDELKQELLSAEMVDKISIELVPPKNVVDESLNRIRAQVTASKPETLRAETAGLTVRLYVDPAMSPNDPYVVTDSAKPQEVVVIVNTSHPHWSQLKGSEGVLNYFRHCTYDAVAEWQARSKAARIDPNTIKMLKDALLRLPSLFESHGDDSAE
jgi:hypothetical protein